MPADHLSVIILLSSEVTEVLNNINPAKVPDPDNIPGKLLEEPHPKLHPLSAACSTFRCHFVNSRISESRQVFVLFSKKMTQR